jgi:sulfate permease, SulP family
LLTAVGADAITKHKHKGNLELVGQGIGNIITALFGGIPGSGGVGGTMANINAGGRTNISGLIKAAFLMIVLFGLGTYIKHVPISVLAALLIFVGFKIIDFKGILKLVKIRSKDLIVLFLVLGFTIFADLLVAIGVGMVLASFFFMQSMGNLMEDQTKSGNLGEMKNKIKVPKFLKKEIYIIQLDGPIFYGFADEFKSQTRKLKNIQAVIIDMSSVPYIDASGIFMLEEVINDFHTVEVEVVLVGVKPHIFKNLEDLKLIPSLLAEEKVYNRVRSGVKYLVHKLTNEL